MNNLLLKNIEDIRFYKGKNKRTSNKSKFESFAMSSEFEEREDSTSNNLQWRFDDIFIFFIF